MMTPLFRSDGTPDYTGVLQRVAGIWQSYANDPVGNNAFIQAVGGGSLWRSSTVAANVLRPNWFVWTSGNVLYCHVAGTDLVASRGAHLWADVAGYAILTQSLEQGQLFHQFFLAAAREVANYCLSVLAMPLPTPLVRASISGHSYGGAVAGIAAWLISQAGPSLLVDFCSFGEPKSVLGTSSAAVNPAGLTFINPQDACPYCPPNLDPVFWGGALTGARTWFGSDARTWQHMGTPTLIEGNAIRTVGRQDASLNALPIPQTLVAHQIETYRNLIIPLRRIQNGWDAPDAFEMWLLGSAQPPIPVDPGPPPGERITLDAPLVNTTLFGSSSPTTPLTPANQGDTISVISSISVDRTVSPTNIAQQGAGMLYKFTFFCDDTRYGDSNSMILFNLGALTPGQLDTVARRWIQNFSLCLSNAGASRPSAPSLGTAMVTAYRVGPLVQKGQTILELGPYAGSNAPGVWSTRDGNQQFNSGLNVRMRALYVQPAAPPILATDWWETTNLWMASPPDNVINKDQYIFDGNTLTTPAGSAGTYGVQLQRFINYITGQAGGGMPAPTIIDQWGHMGIDPSIPQLNLTDAVYVPGVAPRPGNWTFTVDVPGGVQVRSIINIKTANARGWNGNYRVLNVTGNIVTIATKFPPNYPGFTAAKGYITRNANGTYNQVFYRYQSYVSIKPSVRKPSRPFSPVSFRKRQRAPKTSL